MHLTEATKKIGSGDFDIDVKTKTNDEIADLADAVNMMSRQLKRKNDELNAERIKRFDIATDAQEKERERLSRELHDGIGQSLIAIKLRLQQLYGLSKSDNEKVIADVELSLDNAIDDIRKMSNDLMPSVLREFGLENAIRKICNELMSYSNCVVKFEYNFSKEIKNKKVVINLYRMIQEAINNIQKYSKANRAEISIFELDDFLEIVIVDYGVGFNSNTINKNTGSGLFNIKERAKILDGYAEITTAPDAGVRIHIKIPVSRLEVK